MEGKQCKEKLQAKFPSDIFKKWKSAKLGRVEDDIDTKKYPYMPSNIIKSEEFYARFNTEDLFIIDSRVVKHHYALHQGYQMLVDCIYEFINLIPKLNKSEMYLYSLVKMLVQLNHSMVSAENVVTVRLNFKELVEFVPNFYLDERAFRRAKKGLIDNNLISPIPDHKDDYFINFMVFFCGNRDIFIEQYQNALKYSRDIDKMQRIRNTK